MRLIDLSHPLQAGIPTYPGDAPFALTTQRTHPQHGYHLSHLSTGLHVGTHIDVPLHLVPSDIRTVHQFPLHRFHGRGVLLDVQGKALLTPDNIDLSPLLPGDAVLLHTGFDAHFANPNLYFSQHPVVDVALAEALASKGVALLGMDMPSPDRPPFRAHTLLLEKEIVLIENMTNLAALAKFPSFAVFAIPLPLDAEGSPVRAFALVP